jgi:hypothetical protein
MNIAQTYAVNESRAISETLEGETIIINLETGSYYSMNRAGTELWDAIVSKRSFDMTDKSTSDFITFLDAEGLIMPLNQATDGELVIASASPIIDKYEDMQEMLLADPIHDVDTAGWPKLKDDQ